MLLRTSSSSCSKVCSLCGSRYSPRAKCTKVFVNGCRVDAQKHQFLRVGTEVFLLTTLAKRSSRYSPRAKCTKVFVNGCRVDAQKHQFLRVGTEVFLLTTLAKRSSRTRSLRLLPRTTFIVGALQLALQKAIVLRSH